MFSSAAAMLLRPGGNSPESLAFSGAVRAPKAPPQKTGRVRDVWHLWSDSLSIIVRHTEKAAPDSTGAAFSHDTSSSEAKPGCFQGVQSRQDQNRLAMW